MTKKKPILAIFVVTAILICVIVTLIWYVSLSLPYQGHRCTDKNPLETMAFLPKPDSMLYISPSGESRVLTDAEAERVYASFSILMDRIKSFTVHVCKGGDSIKVDGKEWVLKSGLDRIEFRYNRRQCYTGGSPANMGIPLYEPLEFDAMMLILQNNRLRTVPYKGRRYSNEGAETADLEFYANYYEFKQVVSDMNLY